MEPLICPDCGLEHTEPADAGLGHRILCLGCALARELADAPPAAAPPLAA